MMSLKTFATAVTAATLFSVAMSPATAACTGKNCVMTTTNSGNLKLQTNGKMISQDGGGFKVISNDGGSKPAITKNNSLINPGNMSLGSSMKNMR